MQAGDGSLPRSRVRGGRLTPWARPEPRRHGSLCGRGGARRRCAALLAFPLLSACAGATSWPPGPGALAAGAGAAAPGARARANTTPEPAPAGTFLRSGAERTGIDVIHYDLDLDLRSGTPAPGAAARPLEFRGRARLRVRLATAREPVLPLDFAALTIDSVLVDGVRAAFEQRPNELVVVLPPGAPDGERTVEVAYQGAPRHGLLWEPLGGERLGIFADNWPNRARWWFPSNDHPSDKATVRLTVRAPAGLRVVANGVLRDSAAGVWQWETRTPVPTYTMVIGVAPFQVVELGRAACDRAPAAPGPCALISLWALPGDSAFGVERFARAANMVEFFTELVGPFPYEKLAHVESATRFGGMENASAIFYARTPWARGTMGEGVIAHETAHQWFGDAVTPREWHDLWLSEGFASYFGPLYFAARDGPDVFRRLMSEARDAYLRSSVVGRPVVDSVQPGSNLFDLLNANNYDKAAWVLHMLRGMLGDSVFFAAVRQYYVTYAHGNAGTEDLRRVMEETARRDLGWFFTQWLYRPGYPQLRAAWSTREAAAGVEVELVLRQLQPPGWPTFRLPLEVDLYGVDGRIARHRLELTERADTFRFHAPRPVTRVEIDPDERVLKTLEIRGPRH